MFDYSKCTYKELKSILNRFDKHAKNESFYRFNKNADNYIYAEYCTLIKSECREIKNVLLKSMFLDADEVYERYYNEEKTRLNKKYSIKEVNSYTRLRKLSCSSKQEDSVLIDAIERAIRERVEELKKRDYKMESIKEGNKRRFLLKGRV